MLDIQLSSYEFRTYRKRSGHISLRHRSHLLIPTNAGFRLSAYLSIISANLTLPDSTRIEIDEVAFDEETAFKYDGKVLVHGFYLRHIVPRDRVDPGLGLLRINYEFTFAAGHPESHSHEHPAIILRLPYSRSA